MRFDLPLLIIAISLFVISMCAAALFVLGSPTAEQFGIGKEWFIVFAAIGLVLTLVSLKLSLKQKPEETAQPKSKLTPSMKKDPGPIVRAADLKQAKIDREPKVSFPQTETYAQNEWDKSFESVQNLVVEDEEVAEPPKYEQYFEEPVQKKKSFDQMMAERKRIFYSQAERESSASAPSESPTPVRNAAHTAEQQTEPQSRLRDVAQRDVVQNPLSTGSGSKLLPGISPLSYAPAGASPPIAGASFYFEDMPELKYFKASVFRPKVVEFKSTPNDPNSKAQVKLFGMNLKVTSKPKIGNAPAPSRFSPEPRLGVGFQTPTRSLDDIRRNLHGK